MRSDKMQLCLQQQMLPLTDFVRYKQPQWEPHSTLLKTGKNQNKKRVNAGHWKANLSLIKTIKSRIENIIN
jgi:hypothetical protein